jgi:hypothetical protein
VRCLCPLFSVSSPVFPVLFAVILSSFCSNYSPLSLAGKCLYFILDFLDPNLNPKP